MGLYFDGSLVQVHFDGKLCKLHLGRRLSPRPWYTAHQEMLLQNGTKIIIEAYLESGEQGSTSYNFSGSAFTVYSPNYADTTAIICNSSHWGTGVVYGSIIQAGTFIHLYDFNIYDHTAGYAEVISQAHLEAAYIIEHGTYLGSLVLTADGYWEAINYGDNI